MTADNPGNGHDRLAVFLSHRSRFHLVFRLTVRAHQVLRARSIAGSATRAWVHRAAAVSGVADVVTAAWLHRSRRFALPARLALDATDITLWSLRTPDPYEAAVLSGVPLALEAGFRLGAGGLIVPAVDALVAVFVRRRRSRPPDPAAFKWQLMAVGGGAGLAWYQRRRRQEERVRREQEREAKCHQARLSGQHSVAMGADSVVDLLARTTPLLQGSLPDTVTANTLASWKASLGAEVIGGTSYLDSVLRLWVRRHNTRADLTRDVDVALAEDAGTTLVTVGQAQVLSNLLDGRDLRGSVSVDVVDGPGGRVPGTALRLRVGGAELELPPDPHPPLNVFDPCPMILTVSPLWFVFQLFGNSERAPVWAVAPSVLGSWATAAWAHRQIDRHGRLSHPQVVFAALSLGAVNTVLVTLNMRRPFSVDGLQRYPGGNSLHATAILIALYGDELSTIERRIVLGGLLGILGIGLVLLPGPIRPRDCFSQLLWPVAAVASAIGVDRSLRDDAVAEADDLRRADRQHIDGAFRDGRSSVIELVTEARFAAWRLLGSPGVTVPDSVRAEAQRRLHEVDRRLEALQCAEGS